MSERYEVLKNYMVEAKFEHDVVELFVKERVDVDVFKNLTKNEMLELGVKTVGDRSRVKTLQEVNSYRTYPCMYPCMFLHMSAK